jgi:hypothetical protein
MPSQLLPEHLQRSRITMSDEEADLFFDSFIASAKAGAA